MKSSTLLLTVAIIGIVFGLGFLIIPHTAISIYGSQLDRTGEYMSRYFGSALLGLGIIFYQVRNSKTVEGSHKGILLGGLIFGVSGLVVAILDVFFGTHNSLVWLNVVLYLFFTLGFGYFYFKK